MNSLVVNVGVLVVVAVLAVASAWVLLSAGGRAGGLAPTAVLATRRRPASSSDRTADIDVTCPSATAVHPGDEETAARRAVAAGAWMGVITLVAIAGGLAVGWWLS